MTTDPSTSTSGTSPKPSGGNGNRILVSTPADLRRRSNLFRQTLRFVVLNVKIFKLTRQHHH
jgi:hypothetical protein